MLPFKDLSSRLNHLGVELTLMDSLKKEMNKHFISSDVLSPPQYYFANGFPTGGI